jgi:LuxR family maltose regulon positive regulatory protein
MLGFSLSDAELAVLDQRTEGWIAGLQMAALSMRGRNDIGEFVRALSGSHRYILDYLAEEALQGHPSIVQNFLLQTSLLDRLYADLCDAALTPTFFQDARPNWLPARRSWTIWKIATCS